jgi:hypothetical protein
VLVLSDSSLKVVDHEEDNWCSDHFLCKNWSYVEDCPVLITNADPHSIGTVGVIGSGGASRRKPDSGPIRRRMTDTDAFWETPDPSSVVEGMGGPNPPSVIRNEWYRWTKPQSVHCHGSNCDRTTDTDDRWGVGHPSVRIKMSAPGLEGGQDDDDILGFPGDGFVDKTDANHGVLGEQDEEGDDTRSNDSNCNPWQWFELRK